MSDKALEKTGGTELLKKDHLDFILSKKERFEELAGLGEFYFTKAVKAKIEQSEILEEIRAKTGRAGLVHAAEVFGITERHARNILAFGAHKDSKLLSEVGFAKALPLISALDSGEATLEDGKIVFEDGTTLTAEETKGLTRDQLNALIKKFRADKKEKADLKYSLDKERKERGTEREDMREKIKNQSAQIKRLKGESTDADPEETAVVEAEEDVRAAAKSVSAVMVHMAAGELDSALLARLGGAMEVLDKIRIEYLRTLERMRVSGALDKTNED